MKTDTTTVNVIAAAAIAVSLGGFLWMEHRPAINYSFAVTMPNDADDDSYDPGNTSQDWNHEACSDDEDSSDEDNPSPNEDHGTCLGDPFDPIDTFPI